MTALPKPPKTGPKPRKRISRKPGSLVMNSRKRLNRKTRPAKVRRTPRGKLKKQADTAFANFIKDRDDWTCRVCRVQYREDGPLPAQAFQCAHLWSRRYHSVRWDPRNAVCLCWKDHRFYTAQPILWDLWMRVWLGYDNYHALRELAFEPAPKIDYSDLLRAIQNGEGHYGRT